MPLVGTLRSHDRRLLVFVRTLTRAAMTAALTALAACADAVRPTAPGAAAIEKTGAAPAYVAAGDLVKRTQRLSEDVTETATITPQGGFLWMRETGLLMYFPRGAVSETIVVSATALRGNHVTYDFQPHGTVFLTPILVGQAIQQTELKSDRKAKRPDVWAGYLPNGTGDISADGRARFSEVFTTVWQGSGQETYVLFATSHFSGYAMASGNKPLRDDNY
jgi:hypothetical protein